MKSNFKHYAIPHEPKHMNIQPNAVMANHVAERSEASPFEHLAEPREALPFEHLAERSEANHLNIRRNNGATLCYFFSASILMISFITLPNSSAGRSLKRISFFSSRMKILGVVWKWTIWR